MALIPDPSPAPSIVVRYGPVPSPHVGSDLIQTLAVRFLNDGITLWPYLVPFLVIQVLMRYVVPTLIERRKAANTPTQLTIPGF